jgi:predicted  nucleic acid-binding Zn-ribbon protein
MAKKKNKKDKQDTTASDTVEAVRAAIERTFHATSEGASGTTRQLIDEVTHAAARIRATMEELRVLEDVKGLRSEIEALSRRVAALEAEVAKPAPRSTSRSRSTRAASSRSSSGTQAKPAGTKASSSAKPRSTRSRSTRSRPSSSGGSSGSPS